MKANKPLTDIEWDTCWMAIRYACGRKTIASAMLPRDLIDAYYHRWTDSQKQLIAKDLRSYLETHEYFGSKNIDHPEWMHFLMLLENKNEESWTEQQ